MMYIVQKSRRRAALALTLLLPLASIGCGGNGSQPPPPKPDMAALAMPDMQPLAMPDMLSSPMPDMLLPPTALLSFMQDSQTFGDVVLDATQVLTVQVNNVGNAESGPIHDAVLAGDAAFSILDDGCTGKSLNAGDDCEIKVQFQRATVGDAAATLTVRAVPGGSIVSQLSAHAVTEATLTIGNVDFGTVYVGSAPSVDLTVTNSGGVPSGPLAFTDPPYSQFTFPAAQDACSGKTLAAGASCLRRVVYTPTTKESWNFSVNVAATPGGNASGQLTAQSKRHAKLDAPTQVDFGELPLFVAQQLSVTVANDGDDVLTLTATVDGDAEIQANAVDTSIAGQGSLSIPVTYQRSIKGSSTATLHLKSSAGNTDITLLGHSLAGGDLVLFIANPHLGMPPAGGNGTVIVRNVATVALAVAPAQMSGPFAITDGCGATTVPSGASCTIGVVATPAPTATVRGTLHIPTGNAADVALDAGWAFSAPTWADFPGMTRVKQGSSTDLIVSNLSAAAAPAPSVAIQNPAEDFSIFTNGCTGSIAAGGTCKVTLGFVPTWGQPQSSYDGDPNQTALLSVTGCEDGPCIAKLTGFGWNGQPF